MVPTSKPAARISLAALATCLLFATLPGSAAADDSPFDCKKSTRANFGTDNPSIDCPSLPDTPYVAGTVNAPDQGPIYEDWAWKSFVALNWPAVEPNAQNGYARGFPDPNKTFAGDDTLPVWATWKEKREIFSASGTDPGAWNQAVNYLDAESYEPCTDGDGESLKALKFRRMFAQAGKSSQSLDEDLEVNGEAMLPSEIAGLSVQPRVWKGSRDAEGNNAVLYEVKVNYDYFQYVTATSEPYTPKGSTTTTTVEVGPLYKDTNKFARAANSGNFQDYPQFGAQTAKGIHFPWRNQAVPEGTEFDADKYYSAANCAKQDSQTSDHPCLAGTIQTKSAWVLLGEGDDESTYHTTSAQYFRYDEDEGEICSAQGLFGLIGFHIIQKTFEQPHFIYATWEHESTDVKGAYVYANYYQNPGDGPVPTGYYPAYPDSLPVERARDRLPSTDATNDRYHDLIEKANPASPWSHYNLTGVQFLPVQCYDVNGKQPCAADGFDVIDPPDPTNIGQPFYLANLVVETNWGLQNFQGVPPNFVPADDPSKEVGLTKGFMTSFDSKPYDFYTPNDNPTFDRSMGNTGNQRRNRGRVFNMGGCMGCHGVAQAKGTDFSFVLLNGQKGADVEPANNPYQGFRLYKDQNFIATEVGRVYVESEEQCADACRKQENCSAFVSYVDELGLDPNFGKIFCQLLEGPLPAPSPLDASLSGVKAGVPVP